MLNAAELLEVRPVVQRVARRFADTTGASVEDLTQAALLRLWERRATFNARVALRAWAYQISQSTFLNMAIRAKRERDGMQTAAILARVPVPTPEDIARANEMGRRTVAAFTAAFAACDKSDWRQVCHARQSVREAMSA
jgi:RNA polymerase sigma factor (sigma-70 family)